MAGPKSTSEHELVVVDASVLVEIVIGGRHADGAEALMTRFARTPRLTLVTAAHGLVETANALRKLVFRGVLTAEDGLAALEDLEALDLALDATAARLRRIWSLRDRMSAYDAAYAAVAEAMGAPLITVDERLCRACVDAGIPAMSLDELAAPSDP